MSEQKTALAPYKATIKWQGHPITVTIDDVRRYLCSRASEREIIMFLKMAHSLNLNPWVREVYLVKYAADEPASIIIAIEAYLKSAEQHSQYDGHEAGIIIRNKVGKVKHVEGTFYDDGDLVGGWAKVYRKDRAHPFYVSVNFKEIAKYTREGKLTRFWSSQPATMARKTALARALREAFPTTLGAAVTDAEVTDAQWSEVEEETYPPALEREGKPDWPKFWIKVKKELGLTQTQARDLLNVASIKKDLIDQGVSMEEMWDRLIQAVQSRSEKAAHVAYDAGEQPAFKRNPDGVKSLSDLLRACWEDFSLQPLDVCKELGVGSQKDITALPSECYRQIAAVRK